MAAPTRREHARARRTLGQNFLADPAQARRIAALAVPGPGTLVYEVGAGRGQLTRPLLAEGRLRRALYFDDQLKVIEDPRRKVVEVYDLAADPGELARLLAVGAGRAAEIADATMARVRAATGLLPHA